MNEEKEILDVEDIGKILSKTLIDLSARRISLKQAQTTSRIALALSKNIEHIQSKRQLELLQQVLNKR